MQRPHISVCICTYKRASYLRYLLTRLSEQETEGLFTYSIVVVDNDRQRSAEPVVAAFAEASPLDAEYVVEPLQSISLARNMALRHGRGDFIAFIDDDEFPPSPWLKKLFTECTERQVDGVLGPVKPQYEAQPPPWVLAGGFYDRQSYPTGLVIDGRKGRTGNVLFRRAILDGESEPFRPQFRTGEDQDFFRRMISKGCVFTWCNEAIAYEWVPAIRWRRRFLLKRALLRGAMSAVQPTIGDVLKSIVAVGVYVAILPFFLLTSQVKFMRYLVSLCDHLGKLLALLRINPVAEQYVTE
jgi:glycosyltransferase involved in cell wall biosynthesis